MKLLLSCVNTEGLSLVGFDRVTGKIFWACSDTMLRSCGICYHNDALWVATDNQVTIIGEQIFTSVRLQGAYNGEAHSIHPLSDDIVGVADTGNSRITKINNQGEIRGAFEPFAPWGVLPQDAFHLNDFAVTPKGILASCFDHRPWRMVQKDLSWDEWSKQGYGILVRVTEGAGRGIGSIAAGGLSNPHSLCCGGFSVYLCSSATGLFHHYKFNSVDDATLVPHAEYQVVESGHFLRGALNLSANWWLLGGSSVRHGEIVAKNMELYLYNLEQGIDKIYDIPFPGEIYDILPWNEDVMQHVVRRFPGRKDL